MYITQDLNQWFKNEISVLNISLNVSVQRILCVEYKSTKKRHISLLSLTVDVIWVTIGNILSFFFLIKRNQKYQILNRTTRIIFFILRKHWFKGYRCESAIPLCIDATRNYVDSPFKQGCVIFEPCGTLEKMVIFLLL